eukprot:CAMPEP_0117016422 /NCGR_PEP_ID=MMETSP0472-20121206/12953_1 /TAXON_ID=693140 ORGANISM="Tiarina fusus, Strain LIS" /NCGR_SAMPLE_ID=MMETSP0472 /ASSEMBLY_ACC=CAM_ASM_000603 /LENGTH=656 /DNA_ID=CAMNT_0004720477 /DNA_START=156 /DNA_END=2127 /DNA_ORIENTATION=-
MSSMLSSGVKKEKASRVFGDVVFNEAETSLCYSPSPHHSTKSTNAEQGRLSASPTVLFGREETVGKEMLLPISEDKENISNTNSSCASEKSLSAQSIRSAELSRLRATTAKSPQRRDLFQKTQAAVNNAATSVTETLKQPSGSGSGASVNPSLNAVRKAKDAALQDRKTATKSVRFQWDGENGQAKSFYNRLEDNRRQILDIQRKLSSAHFKQKTEKQEAEKRKRLAGIEEQYLFNSEVYREHQKTLKETRDKDRKKSIEAREKIRQNKREGANKLKTQEVLEEQAVFDVRYDMYRGRQETARANADARRKSYQFRAGDAKRIRQMRSQWQEEKVHSDHENFELRRAGAKDVEAYKESVAAARRQSLKSRNAYAKQIREAEVDEKKLEMKHEHESYELKFQGEKDAEAYRRRMQEERRNSLANRNKESRRHAEVMLELRNLAQEHESESYMLKWEGERDVKTYLKQVRDNRRKSLQFRGEEFKRRKQQNEEQRAREVAASLAEGDLQRKCQMDVDNYKKECAENIRKSLEFRGKEKKMQRLEQLDEETKVKEVDHKNFELDSLARLDVEEYMKDCKRRRRKSLAFRAKEKRRHAEWMRLQKEKELEERSRTAHFQSLNAQHTAFARQKERAQAAVDALRSAGCSIKGNPFGDVLHM